MANPTIDRTSIPAIISLIHALDEGEHIRLLARPGIGLTTYLMCIANEFSTSENLALLRIKSNQPLISLRLLGPEKDGAPERVSIDEALSNLSLHQPKLILIDDLEFASQQDLNKLHQAAENWTTLGTKVVWGLHWSESEHDAPERFPQRIRKTEYVPPLSDTQIGEIISGAARLSQEQLDQAIAACCGNPTIAYRIIEELHNRSLPGASLPPVIATQAIYRALFSIIQQELRSKDALIFALLSCLFPIEHAYGSIPNAIGMDNDQAAHLCDHLAHLAFLTPDHARTQIVRRTIAQFLSGPDRHRAATAVRELCKTVRLRDPEAALDTLAGEDMLTASLTELLRTSPSPKGAQVAQAASEEYVKSSSPRVKDTHALQSLTQTYLAPAISLIQHTAAMQSQDSVSISSAIDCLSLTLIIEASDRIGPALVSLISNTQCPSERSKLLAWASLIPIWHLKTSREKYRLILREVISDSANYENDRIALFSKAVHCAHMAARGVCPNASLNMLEKGASSLGATAENIHIFQLLAFIHSARGHHALSEQWLVRARASVNDDTVRGAFNALLRMQHFALTENRYLTREEEETLTSALIRIGAPRICTWAKVLSGSSKMNDFPEWCHADAHPALIASYRFHRGKSLLASDQPSEGLRELYSAGRVLSTAHLSPLVFGNWRKPLLAYYLHTKAHSASRCIADDNFKCQLRYLRLIGQVNGTNSTASNFSLYSVADSQTAESDQGRLSKAELRVVREITNGASNQQAARALYLSKRTVDTHLRNIYKKLEIQSRTQLQKLVESGELHLN